MGIETCGPVKFHPTTFLQSCCEMQCLSGIMSSFSYVSPTHQNHHCSHTEREPEYEASTGETELREQELVILLEHFISACQKPELPLNNHVWIFSFVSQKIFFSVFFFLKFVWLWFLSFAVKRVCTNHQSEVVIPGTNSSKHALQSMLGRIKEVRIGHSCWVVWDSLSRSSALSSYIGQEI